MKKYLKEAKYAFIASNLLAIVNVICISYYPYLLSYVVDHFDTLNHSVLIWIFTSLIVSIALIIVTSYFNKLSKARYQKEICTSIRRDIFRNVAHFGYTTFHSQSIENYTSFLINDVERLYVLYFENLIYLCNSVLMLVVYAIVLALVSWQMCLVIMGSLFLILFIPQLVGKRFHALNASASSSKADYLSRCEEILFAHDLLDESNRLRLCKLHDARLQNMQENEYSVVKYRSFVQIFSGSALYFQMILCFVVGLILAYCGIISVGIFASTLLYVEYISQYSCNIVDEFLEIRSSKTYRDKCLKLLYRPAERAKADSEPFRSLRLESVSYQIGEIELLQMINYEFAAGKKYLITGPNGSGKSTLLKLLAGLIHPTSGQLLFNGTTCDLHGDVGYIPQRRYVFEGSLLDNISLFSEEITQDDYSRISDMCTMLHLNHPIDYRIARNGENLSGGEIAKICLIRELYRGKGLLLIDEPLNDIDVNAEADILGYLEKSGKTIIMVAHGLSKESSFDEVLRLQDGKLTNKDPKRN